MAKYLNSIYMNADVPIIKKLNSLEDLSLGAIADSFMLAMGKISLDGLAKAVVHLTENAAQENEHQILIDVVEIKKHLPVDVFFSLSSELKKEMLLKTLCDALDFLAKLRNITLDLVQIKKQASATLKEFTGFIGKKITRPDKGAIAQIGYTYTKFIEVVCIIHYKDGRQVEVPMFSAPAMLASLLDTIGSVTWLDLVSLRVNKKKTDDYWLVNIESKETDYCSARASIGQPHGMYDLGIMYLEGRTVIKNNNKAIFWLKKAADAGYGKASRVLESLE